MKKGIIMFVFAILLVGCGVSHQHIMVQNEDEEYGLLQIGSEDEPNFIYDDYEKLEGGGYIIQQGEDFGYISDAGEELISVGEYESLTFLEQMIVATNSDDEVSIYDKEGKQLYSEEEITISGLPIIYKDNEYIVLSDDGTELITTDEEVVYVSLVNTMYIIIGYKDSIDIIDISTKEAETIDLSGNYLYMDDKEGQGYLFYDDTANRIAYVDQDFEIVFTLSQQADTVYFDANDNIIVKKDDTKWLLSSDGEDRIAINSYYQGTDTYVIKNNEFIYGPHVFYHGGTRSEVDGIQLDPLASFTRYDVFPVFVRERGYQFYSFEGEPAFDTIYRRATGFDRNGRAIVSEDGDIFYLVDTNNETKSNEYMDIEHIGKTFYAGYTTDNRYVVFDKDGTVLLDTYFIGEKNIVSYQDVDYGIFGRSGKSYVYNMQTFELLFSCEGSVEFNSEGYFVNDNKIYYDMKGEKIFSR